MGLADMKYKDDLPVRTINKIRGILGELGLLTVETAWRNSVEGFYSVSVAIEGTELMTNGKGVTRQYALASAYGEMMERLQNFCTFRLGMDFDVATLTYPGFFYAPDEVGLSLDDALNSEEEWLSTQLARVGSVEERRHLLELWQGVSYEEVPADFVALPYINLCSGRLSRIPIKMINKMYMSNGMCAGNTAEEALVQGLSEVLERYVNKRIVREKLVPPTIPRSYLTRFPRLDAMVAGIENSGNFEVIFKDCALGQGLPVVGVIYINRDDQSYFVKFGAHPVFEIAAERTLTELLQGQEIKRMMGVREFSYRNDASRDPDNLIGILVNGSGVYPTEFFSGRFSYPFHEFTDVSGLNNRELLAHLVRQLSDAGHDVFVRDVSFLGFPSFHLIVPGISEIDEFDDTQAIIAYSDYNCARRLIRNADVLDEKGAAAVIDFFRRNGYSNDTSVMEALNLPVKGEGFPWYYSNIDLFITALCCRRGDLTGAYEAFDKFLSEHAQQARNNGSLTFYKCVRDFLASRIDGLPEREAGAILAAFYSPDVVRGAIADFSQRESILSYQGQLNCWQCHQCPFAGGCLYSASAAVYRLLKERYAANPPDQLKLLKFVAVM